MTQSFNLSQLANNVNSAGKLNAAQGLTNTVPVPNGGTGQSSFADGELLIGNSNGNTLTKAKLTAGNNIAVTEGPGSITIALANTVPVPNGGTGQSSFANGELLIGNSNGNTLTKAKLTAGNNVTITEGPGSITIAAAGGGGGPVGGELGYALYTSGSGTWTCPAGVTRIKATVVGGGGAGSTYYAEPLAGGSGGVAVGYYTVVPGTAYAYTVGVGGSVIWGQNSTAGGTSSLGAFLSATGGGAPPNSVVGGAHGVGSGGTVANSIVIYGVPGFSGYSIQYTDTNYGVSKPGVVWSPTLLAISGNSLYPALPGLPGSNDPSPGVGGVVYIEYVQVEGTTTAGSIGDYALFTSGSGTWTCPSGVTKVKVTCIGGGGVANPLGFGLPFGGLAIGVYTVTPGTGYAYTVGAGGTHYTNPGGGNSSLAGLCSATGGTVQGSYNLPGVGSGGTFTNSAVASFAFVGTYPAVYASAIPPFAGDCARSLGDNSPLVWTPTSGFIPGAAGGTWDVGNNGQWTPLGGVGGAILIEYIG